MTRAVVAFALLAACDPYGDDVFLGPTAPPKENVTCTLTPGEDACSRFGAASADARSVIANATSFAGDARDLVRRLDESCLAIVIALGTKREPATGTEPRDRMKAVCRDAFTALGAARPATAKVLARPVACRDAPIPRCVLDGIQVGWQSCAAPTLTIQGIVASNPSEADWARVVEAHVPAVVAASTEIGFLGERGAKARVAFDGASEATRADQCVAESAHLVSGAILDVAAAIAVTAQGTAAVDLRTTE